MITWDMLRFVSDVCREFFFLKTIFAFGVSMAKNFRSGAFGLVDVWILFFSFSYELLLHIGNQSAVQEYEGLVIFCLVLWCYYNMSKDWGI